MPSSLSVAGERRQPVDRSIVRVHGDVRPVRPGSGRPVTMRRRGDRSSSDRRSGGGGNRADRWIVRGTANHTRPHAIQRRREEPLCSLPTECSTCPMSAASWPVRCSPTSVRRSSSSNHPAVPGRARSDRSPTVTMATRSTRCGSGRTTGGKRSVEIDIDTAEGQAAVRDLAPRRRRRHRVRRPPGRWPPEDSGPRTSSRCIQGSSTPRSPRSGRPARKAQWRATDLTVVAAGMQLKLMGDDDRPPVRIPLDQSFLHAAAEGAAATMVALLRPQPVGPRPTSRRFGPAGDPPGHPVDVVERPLQHDRRHAAERRRQARTLHDPASLTGRRRLRVGVDPVRRGDRPVRRPPVRVDPRRGHVRRQRPRDRLAQLRRRGRHRSDPADRVRQDPGGGRPVHRHEDESRAARSRPREAAAHRADRNGRRRGRLRPVRSPRLLARDRRASHRPPDPVPWPVREVLGDATRSRIGTAGRGRRHGGDRRRRAHPAPTAGADRRQRPG